MHLDLLSIPQSGGKVVFWGGVQKKNNCIVRTKHSSMQLGNLRGKIKSLWLHIGDGCQYPISHETKTADMTVFAGRERKIFTSGGYLRSNRPLKLLIGVCRE